MRSTVDRIKLQNMMRFLKILCGWWTASDFPTFSKSSVAPFPWPHDSQPNLRSLITG